jgi:phosphomannomutase/phosphoglucomutase
MALRYCTLCQSVLGEETHMQLNPSIFREYDIRGLVDTDFTPQVVYLLGVAAGRYFRAAGENHVLIARDNRLSGPTLRNALISGLQAEGMQITDIGVVITPAFYYAREHLKINAGIMLTASHNPAEFNGMKVALGAGTIHGAEIQRLGQIAQAAAVEAPNMKPVVETEIRYEDIIPAYLQMQCDKIKLGPKKLKVALDCGNGTASLFAVDFLHKLGCEVIPLYCESDGTFPNHHPDPTQSKNVVDLQKAVLEHNCDLGVGYDGDGDRIGIIDNKGCIIWGDRLMVIYWKEILAKHPGADVIVEVKCSQALVDEVVRMGGKPQFYKTGHSLIKAKMREINALFTGEMSGHMFFADEFYGFDDAFYATGRLLRILSNSEQTLAEMMAHIPTYYSTAETRVACPDEEKFAVVADLTRRFKETHEVIDIDGARVLFGDGWGLARCSNTQPVIVARCEGTTPEALEHIKDTMYKALRSYPCVGEFEWAE